MAAADMPTWLRKIPHSPAPRRSTGDQWVLRGEGGIFLSQVVSPGHMVTQVKPSGLSRKHVFLHLCMHMLSLRGEHEFGGRHKRNRREEGRQMQFSYIKFSKKLN